MENKIIGFVGLDVQDTILYLSRIFLQMGKRVLMADYSESRALYYSVPIIPGTDTRLETVEYRGTFFTSRHLSRTELEQFDVSMLFLGFAAGTELDLCTHIVYTTDGERNHIQRLAEIPKQEGPYRQLVFRNAAEGWGRLLSADQRQREAGLAVCEEPAYYCRDSGREKRLRAQCQYQEKFRFRGLSRSYKGYLKATVRAVFPEEASGPGFADCFRRAEMGE
ncbi:MAG: hypothetical protein K2N94_15525 [Lachnospiraceae bacterium]|nr:hypothetical protein [Lachnospiraceae bacterium]